MSIFGSMKTAVSGMNAQANRLSTVADNIANVNTTGYKSVSTSFSSLVLPSSGGNYNSGGVQSSVRQSVSDQGDISYTTSSTDLAISGDGFFIVQGADGTPVLTRAGDFQKDDEGNLVNAAGFMLMGYSYDSGSPAVVVNGFDGLVPVNVNQEGLTAIASTSGIFKGNLDSGANVVAAAATRPSANPATPTADTKKFSMVAYDTLGNKVMYDFYFTKTSVAAAPPPVPPAVNSSWEVSIYRNADAAVGGTTSFPYTTAGGDVGLGTLNFDANGKMVSGGAVNIVDPVTGQTINMDLTGFTQLGADFAGTGTPNGQAASPVKDVTIDGDGIVYAKYEDGTNKPLYRIPLANVASPDKLTLQSGNVYSANGQSGVTVTGFPQTNGLGTIKSGALEGSNVDLAGELTEMIESQRSYTANSKVFQTGSDIMDVLVNLKR
ncbi:flagellar hook protein FlgE [Rhizobium leguminosarum]|uniref:flagellar hook protein FlgE n=1 Tax=Rhizobium TaxID=379 RepID=UPI00102F5CB4|nr:MULTISPECIES: flagellar hook protein FlgE [Rhizobium]MCJ9693629.1 flagellar hook protein FlgE [Rhizobium sp. PRIMUS64]MDV4159600.1 flagellar hook protein FlgE [Rhizobium leguminosarum]MDV4174446.1 flagellar hook protein FlgE [Rhizobium leguminosarum]NKJ91333.1 flagellar hook-basal body complex protein [Rhizobium leguminosarum bv. viciae]NKK45948.1 flagellar hook-basal body complex protein [Rhizobium leguminosarum bv. viciae]